MAAPVIKSDNSVCRVCGELLQKKSRRSIFNQFFGVFEQLCEVLEHSPHINDEGSPYVCSVCFNKLSKLKKIEFDIANKEKELTDKKLNLLMELRKQYLGSSQSTPKEPTKRIIQYIPTFRKVKIRPSVSICPFLSPNRKVGDVATSLVSLQ